MADRHIRRTFWTISVRSGSNRSCTLDRRHGVPCVPLQCCSIVLKQAGIYDTTLILVAADHGVNPGNFKSDLPGSREQWLHRGAGQIQYFS
jgi:hypothetical protein